MKKLTKENFIKRAKEVHGDKYDYSKVDYVNSRTKICIICPEHGEFWQEPSAHLRGYSCPKCSNKHRGEYKKLGVDKFIKKSIQIHGEKYDYSKVEYINVMTKVCIICPEHGEFYMTPAQHLSGQGCPKCSGRNLTKDELIKKFRDVHGDKYDYSKVELGKLNDKVCFICPEHGEFYQSPTKHLRGQGCPKCGKTKNKHKISRLEYIKRAIEIHGDLYDYRGVKLNSLHDKVTITCKKHGQFTQYAYDHLNGHGCPVCGKNTSNAETEIYNYITSLIGEENVIQRDRSLLTNGKELDLYIPSHSLAIEFNGLRWHSEIFTKDKNYHLNKTDECKQCGIKLLHVFEDEYKFHKDIVLSKIRHLLGKDNLPKIMGRKCVIEEIESDMAKSFLKNNHIQGFVRATKYYGAFIYGCLVGVMTFLKEGDGIWTLNRFATDNKFTCQGIGGKLFSRFVKDNNPKLVKSFADRRWTFSETGNIYTKLGFKLIGISEPDYKYIKTDNPTHRFHKFNFRKKILSKKYGFSMKKTEREMVKELGYSRIWDCGLYKYEWKP